MNAETNPNLRPKLTDDAVSRLPLEIGRAELLEEIMRTEAPEQPTPVAARSHRRWWAPLAAAAAVAAIAGSTVWWHGHDTGSGPAPAGPSGASGHQRSAPRPTATPTPAGTPTPSGHTTASDPAAAPPSAAQVAADYRAVLTGSGWTVRATEDQPPYGEVDYQNGDQSFEITWYGSDSYQSYVDDREHIVSPPAPGDPVRILGATGQLWPYDATDHTIIREVRAGHWMEVRGTGMSKSDFLSLVDRLRLVDTDEYEAALPDTFVTTKNRLPTALKMLSGITDASGAQFPSGQSFTLDSSDQDPYQLGAHVAGEYACAWLEEFQAATQAGDQARADEAARVLGTSRQWPVLQQMQKTGDYPAAIWGYADQVGQGQVPDGYRQGLACPS